MPDNSKVQTILRTAVGYGAGLSLGTLLTVLLLKNGIIDLLLSSLDRLQLFLYLLFSIGLIILIVGLGSGLGGAVGGWVLAKLKGAEQPRRVIWRSALSFFITSALLILPIVLFTAIYSFLNPDIDVRFSKLPVFLAFWGLIYGAIAGFLLGWLTAGIKHALWMLLASMAGFAIGGFIAGIGLYLLFQLDNPGRLVTLLLLAGALFLFGAAGGAAIGFAALYIEEARTIIPQTRQWRLARNIVLLVIALFVFYRLANIVETFTIRPASLANNLSLPTQGTHWLPEAAPPELGELPAPTNTYTDSNGRTLAVGCDAAGQITLTYPDGRVEQIPFPPCTNQPLLGEDNQNNLHLIWYSNQAQKVTGPTTTGHFLYGSRHTANGWTEPAIIARLTTPTQPTLHTDSAGTLHLIWDEQGTVHSASQTSYQCDESTLNPIGQAIYNVVRQEKFRPASDPIPFCQNRFEQLLITPNPTAPRSDLPSSQNGAFDRVSELVITANYEVLFTTMQWDRPSEFGSPGSTMAQAVAGLYKNIQENPEAYPRGLTVRLLLGNLPNLDFSNQSDQIIYVMQDLRDAGVTEMVNEDIGWKLEIANFDGAWPHAHSKFVVVDGKEGIAAGFNYSYLHLSKDHPSGQGLDMTDKGLEITGPLAQSMMASYDDLWSGSDLLICSQFPPPIPALSFIWCDKETAVASHVPEVLRFYPVQDGSTNAFTLTHTSAFLESDEAILAALTSAQETIDLYEVNFSLDTVCLGALLLTELCRTDKLAPPYMHALVTAIVENDVKVRAVVEKTAMNGFENRLGIRWLQNELAKHGKEGNFEVKFAAGKIHDKTVLIDKQFLIVGSQNFHWSAWDSPSLTEFNIGTDDPLAIAEWQQEFEFQWRQGIPAGELMPLNAAE